MPFGLGVVEVILILAIFFIIFGAGKLPQVGEVIGKGIRFLRRGKSGEKGEEEETKTTGRSKKKVIRKIED